MNIAKITYWFKDLDAEFRNQLQSNVVPPVGADVFRHGKRYKVVDVKLFLDHGDCDVFLEEKQ